jgi:hypothetical protein
MEGRLEKLERAVKDLEEAVSRQERRVAALEGLNATQRGEEAGRPESRKDADSSPAPVVDQWSMSAFKGTPALVGRSLLILAGAFLLRALTEAGTLATATGVALGLAYGASWIFAAAMAARKGARASAGFFGVCAAVIASPLIFEASTEFGVLSPTGSAAMLALMTAAGLILASRWRLPESAWVFVIGALVTAAALAVVRPPGEAATAVLVALGLAAAWSEGLYRWESLRWLTAVGADVGVLRLTAMATAPDGPHGIDPPRVLLVAALQAVLLLGYVGSSFARAHGGRHQIRVFDYVQTAIAWIIGWGGAIQLAEVHEIGSRGLAGFPLVVGVAAYAVAFGVVEKSHGKNRSFFYLSTLGLSLVLVGFPGAVGDASAVVWAVLAMIFAVAGSRWNQLTLLVHAASLLIAAWISSGLAAETVSDLSGRAGAEAIPGTRALLVAILTVATTVFILLTRRLEKTGWVQRLPLTVMLVLSGAVMASTMVSVAELVAPGAALWMGTVALSMMTVVAALLASRWGVREAGWIVYPLLAVTGLRVVLADLASGRTLVFVVALAAYGAALITSPKILRSRRVQSKE